MFNRLTRLADRLVGNFVPAVTAEAGEEFEMYCGCQYMGGSKCSPFYQKCRTLIGGGYSCGVCLEKDRACTC